MAYICSRYYRAPELIFGATDYTSNIGSLLFIFKINFVLEKPFQLFNCESVTGSSIIGQGRVTKV